MPISASQDTAGPIAHSVGDAALLLSVIAGSDPADPATADADRHRLDLSTLLDSEALRGRRIGVLRFLADHGEEADAVFERGLATLRDAGATLVEIKNGPDLDAIGAAETTVLLTEFKAGLDTYLATTPQAVRSRSLAAVIAFNASHADRELGLFGQDLMIKAQAMPGLDDPGYRDALAKSRRLAGAEGIDRLLAEGRLDALVAPTGGPAWVVDLINGDHDTGSASTLPAVAGTPHLTVPMGAVQGLPVGMSFIGPAWSEQRLLGFGHAFAVRARIDQRPDFRPTLLPNAAQQALLAPDRP